MIFYFSGTGNSAWTAWQLANLTGDRAVDIHGLKDIPDLNGEQQIGFVFPIYAWGAPEIMRNFAKRLPRSSAFTYGVCTCGGDAGIAMRRFAHIYPLNSSYSLIMPNNYIVGSDTEERQVIMEKISNAKVRIKQIAEEILEKKAVYCVKEGKMAWLKSYFMNFGFNRFARTAKPFSVSGDCTGCGKCEKNCPSEAIVVENGRPVWKEQCIQCMRCINACPQEAIQYGAHTKGRQRYLIQKYVAKEENQGFDNEEEF